MAIPELHAQYIDTFVIVFMLLLRFEVICYGLLLLTEQGNQRWQIPGPATCQCLAMFTN